MFTCYINSSFMFCFFLIKQKQNNFPLLEFHEEPVFCLRNKEGRCSTEAKCSFPAFKVSFNLRVQTPVFRAPIIYLIMLKQMFITTYVWREEENKSLFLKKSVFCVVPLWVDLWLNSIWSGVLNCFYFI